MLLKDVVDAVGGDGEIVSSPKNMRDGLCTSASALVQSKDSFFEVVRILCVGLSSRSFQLRNLAAVAVLFGELLDPSTADLELLRDQGGIHAVINNTLTDPSDIILVKLHFTWWLVGQIMPTKSLAYTTGGIYQSEFWKALDVSSRTGSRIATSLEEEGLIRREEATYNGQRTYRLLPATKDLDFSLLMAGDISRRWSAMTGRLIRLTPAGSRSGSWNSNETSGNRSFPGCRGAVFRGGTVDGRCGI
jgi:hypothetical protein